MKIDEFKAQQDSMLSQLMFYIKETWINRLTEIVKENFLHVGKGWFNLDLSDNDRMAFEFGKLKKLLVLLRIQMQDTIYELIRKSYFKLLEYIDKVIPKKVTVKSLKEVSNLLSKL